MVKIKQLPKGRAKSPSRVSRPPAFSSTVNVADPSHSVSIETPATMPNMQNTLPVCHQHSLSSASPVDVHENQISNLSVPVANDQAQPPALPPHLCAVSQVGISFYICYVSGKIHGRYSNMCNFRSVTVLQKHPIFGGPCVLSVGIY